MKANKGDYVVLLTGCDGEDTWKNSIGIGYVYKLRKNADVLHFYIEKDLTGSTTNGWGGNGDNNKLTFRPATQQEIEEYNRENKPCKAIGIISYEIY